MKDFYYILGLDANCTSIEVREAYRKLSKKFHPDLNDADGYFEGRFKHISEAYEVLNDPDKRKKHDAALKKSISYPQEVKKQSRVFKTTHINIAFSITLIFITLLFGYYVAKSLRGAKKLTTIIKAAEVVALPTHRKKKHNHKTKAVDTDVATNADKISPNKPFVTTTESAPIATIAPAKSPQKKKTDSVSSATRLANINTNVHKPLAVITPNTPVGEDLAEAYVKANLTGVVNMRKLDKYGSDIVSIIPDNSKITVLERGSSYYKVRFDNKVGYVPKWAVRGN